MQLYAARITGYNFFDPQMGTYQQIKSSGALRYFKPDISLQLTKYETSSNYINKLSNEALDFRMHILLPFCISIKNGQFITAVREKQPYDGQPFLKEPTLEQSQTLYNMAMTVKSMYGWYVDRMKVHRKNAEELMDSLNTEYVND